MPGIFRQPLQPHQGLRYVIQEGEHRDDPPFGLRNPLWPILVQWQGRRLQVVGGMLGLPESVGPIDNPPFGLRNPLWPIVSAWQPRPPRSQEKKTQNARASGAALLPPLPPEEEIRSNSRRHKYVVMKKKRW